jgi:hypothetical protein
MENKGPEKTFNIAQDLSRFDGKNHPHWILRGGIQVYPSFRQLRANSSAEIVLPKEWKKIQNDGSFEGS